MGRSGRIANLSARYDEAEGGYSPDASIGTTFVDFCYAFSDRGWKCARCPFGNAFLGSGIGMLATIYIYKLKFRRAHFSQSDVRAGDPRKYRDGSAS